MPVETELYDILGISTECSEQDIKKAYRKLARQHHPDKGGDEEKFKKLNNAYEILSDPEKKELYDKHGKNGLKKSGKIPEDIFDSMFGSFGLGNIFNIYNNIRKTINKTPPVVHTYDVSLEDLCTRKVIKLRFTRDRPCFCVEENGPTCCAKCSGKGMIVEIKRLGPMMIQQTQRMCEDCQGRGKFYQSCKECHLGMNKYTKTFQLCLTPSLGNGYRYFFPGEGNQNHDQEPGDFIVTIKYKPHPLYQVSGGDLLTSMNITLKESLCGFSRTLIHPDGKDVLVSNNEIIHPNTTKTIPGFGMTNESNLNIKYNIEFPTNLSTEQKEIISKTLN